MKTRVMGKKIEVEYYVNENSNKRYDDDGNVVYEFIGKPKLCCRTVKETFEEICSFEGNFMFNNGHCSIYYINISEDEEVKVNKIKFRADLGEMFLLTDKVISEESPTKAKEEARLKRLLERYNEAMIESNPSMKRYCEVHKLDPKKTDCEKLFEIIFPNDAMYIVSGKILVVKLK